MENIPYKKILCESDRLSTFKNWPFKDGPCNPTSLAKAGFFYTGKRAKDDYVRCFVCFKELVGWNENDDPFDEHRKHSKDCEFVNIGQDQSKLSLNEYFQILNISLKRLIVSFEFHFRYLSNLLQLIIFRLCNILEPYFLLTNSIIKKTNFN